MPLTYSETTCTHGNSGLWMLPSKNVDLCVLRKAWWWHSVVPKYQTVYINICYISIQGMNRICEINNYSPVCYNWSYRRLYRNWECNHKLPFLNHYKCFVYSTRKNIKTFLLRYACLFSHDCAKVILLVMLISWFRFGVFFLEWCSTNHRSVASLFKWKIELIITFTKHLFISYPKPVSRLSLHFCKHFQWKCVFVEVHHPKPEDQPLSLPSVTAYLLLSFMFEGLQIPPHLSQKPINKIIHISSQYVVNFRFVSGSRPFCPHPATLCAAGRRDPLKSECQDQSRRKIARRAAPNR
jgi:hypothetical protein